MERLKADGIRPVHSWYPVLKPTAIGAIDKK